MITTSFVFKPLQSDAFAQKLATAPLLCTVTYNILTLRAEKTLRKDLQFGVSSDTRNALMYFHFFLYAKMNKKFLQLDIPYSNIGIIYLNSNIFLLQWHPSPSVGGSG